MNAPAKVGLISVPQCRYIYYTLQIRNNYHINCRLDGLFPSGHSMGLLRVPHAHHGASRSLILYVI
jgi:hypothetical protein